MVSSRLGRCRGVNISTGQSSTPRTCVSTSPAVRANDAAQRFLSDQDQMTALTGRIFAGHLRSIIGSMTVEQIVRERQTLATEVLDGSKQEMAKIGLAVDSMQIQSIDDMGSGYITAMTAPHNAAIQREAQIAQAQADQAAAEAHQESARRQAEYARQTSVVQAEYSAEVERARAQAAQAGPLADAQAQREVVTAQTELAEREAELRQKQLITEVVKPADAEAERIGILARAEAERMRIQAEVAAGHDRVALDRMLIDQLPMIVREAAQSLAGANVTMLNGADGLGDVATGLVGQGLAVYDTLRRNLAAAPAPTEPHTWTGDGTGNRPPPPPRAATEDPAAT